jgi:hypothetical protein
MQVDGINRGGRRLVRLAKPRRASADGLAGVLDATVRRTLSKTVIRRCFWDCN